MGLAGYGPVPEPGYYFEFYANALLGQATLKTLENMIFIVIYG